MFSDALDQLGYTSNVITGMRCFTLRQYCYGVARTLKTEPTSKGEANIITGLDFLDNLNSGELLCVQGSKKYAYFGELMHNLAKRRKLNGVIVSGCTRDGLALMRNQNSPACFANDLSPIDMVGRGRIVESDVPIEVDSIAISTGDFIFADIDGITVTPQAMIPATLDIVKSILLKESSIIADIESGKNIKALNDQYGIF